MTNQQGNQGDLLNVSVRLAPDLHDGLMEAVEGVGVSKSNVIRIALIQFLIREGYRPSPTTKVRA